MKCLLIDANNYFAKYYYANKEAAIDNLISIIKLSIAAFKVSHCICVFDGEISYRKELYPDYKATRSQKPEDYYELLKSFKNTLKLNKIPQISSKSLEAEDSINLIIKSNPETQFVVLSEDKDVLLLKKYKNCLIYKRIKEPLEIPKICTFNFDDGFMEKYKLFFALNGDSSDNIPGVPGLGTKKSNFLVNKFVSYELIKSILKSPILDLEIIINKKDDDDYDVGSCLKLIKEHEKLFDISYQLFSLFEPKENFHIDLIKYKL